MATELFRLGNNVVTVPYLKRWFKEPESWFSAKRGRFLGRNTSKDPKIIAMDDLVNPGKLCALEGNQCYFKDPEEFRISASLTIKDIIRSNHFDPYYIFHGRSETLTAGLDHDALNPIKGAAFINEFLDIHCGLFAGNLNSSSMRHLLRRLASLAPDKYTADKDKETIRKMADREDTLLLEKDILPE